MDKRTERIFNNLARLLVERGYADITLEKSHDINASKSNVIGSLSRSKSRREYNTLTLSGHKKKMQLKRPVYFEGSVLDPWEIKTGTLQGEVMDCDLDTGKGEEDNDDDAVEEMRQDDQGERRADYHL